MIFTNPGIPQKSGAIHGFFGAPKIARPGPRGSAFGAPAPGASLAAWQRAGRKGRRQSLPGPGGECPSRGPGPGPFHRGFHGDIHGVWGFP